MRNWHLSALALLSILVVSTPAGAAAPIGKTIKASTTVSASGRMLSSSSPVFLNDVLRTNATGLGQFVFDDGTKLAMGPSASLTIDKSIYKGASTGRASIQASKGAFRYISGKLSGRKIATPYGTIGIRGTAFDFTIRNGRLYILLFNGNVSLCGGGGCKNLSRSCDYLVAGGGGISDPQPLSSGRDSGLNIAQAFPHLVNQGRLTSQLRQGGRACLSRTALRKHQRPRSTQAAAAGSEPAEGPAPGPTPSGKSNKGFGNGGEGDDNGPTEARNPGRGNAFGRNK